MKYITIGNASQDERGRLEGGSRGDQTGGEVCFRTFNDGDKNTDGSFRRYKESKGWNVLRARDPKIAAMLVDAMCMAVRNDNIGYSQSDRYSLYSDVKTKGFDTSKATKCNCDCASLVVVCLAYAGVKIDYESYTGNLADNIVATGKFDLNPDGISFKAGQTINWNISKLKPGDILVTRVKGHTMIVVSNTDKAPSGQFVTDNNGNKKSGGSTEETKLDNLYKFKTYSITNSELIQIARLCKQEQGSIDGAKAEASLAANRYEHFDNGYFNKRYSSIYLYMRNSGDFYKSKYYMDNGSYTQEYVDAVKSVLVDGHRTLPVFVDAHDSWGDIREVKTNGKYVPEGYKYKDQYIKDVTKIISYNDSRTWRSEYTFWCFPAVNSDPFGYESSDKRSKYSDSIEAAEYYASGKVPDGSSSGGGPSSAGAKLNPSLFRPYILCIDRNCSTTYNYLDLKFNHGVLGVIIEAGYLYNSLGNKVDTFRNPKCYNQVEAVRSSNLPWGYSMLSTGKNATQARAEIEQLSYIVRKYPPYLGVWIEVNSKKSVKVNDVVISTYEKELERLGLKNLIGLKVDSKSLKKFTWTKFQKSWYLWNVSHVTNLDELNSLLTPEFFDMDGEG